jgi:hypothetical protein
MGAVGGVALLAGVLFLLPPRDDGLDWIRKYSETVTTEELQMPVVGPDRVRRGVLVSFSFKQVPQGFEEDLRRRLVWRHTDDAGALSGILPGDWQVLFARHSNQIHLTHFPRKSWFVNQWTLFKLRLGFGP